MKHILIYGKSKIGKSKLISYLRTGSLIIDHKYRPTAIVDCRLLCLGDQVVTCWDTGFAIDPDRYDQYWNYLMKQANYDAFVYVYNGTPKVKQHGKTIYIDISKVNFNDYNSVVALFDPLFS